MKNLTILLLLLVVISSCKKDEQCDSVPDERLYDFTSDTAKIAYTGFDTLRFQRLDSFGIIQDTITLFGQGKNYSKEYITDHITGEICTTTIYAQKYKIDFVDSITNSSALKLIVEAGEGGGGAEVLFEKANLPFTLWSLANPQFNIYLSSHEVLGKTYFDVSRYISSNNEDIDTAYINKDFGIIEISEGNTTWKLLP